MKAVTLEKTLQTIGEESKRNGTDNLTSQQIDKEVKASRAAKKKEVKVRGVYENPKKSGIWWIVYFAEGKRKREKVGRKSDAIALYQQRKSEIRAGAKMPANLRHKGETLSVVIDRALTWYSSHKPKQLYDATIHLEAFRKDLGSRVAVGLTPTDIDDWISAHEEWSPGTMNRYKATLGRCLQLEVVAGRLGRNVARLVSARKESNTRVRWMNAAEEEKIVAQIIKNCPEQLPAFTVAHHSGMRKGEQFSLEWDEIDFERRKIFLDKTKNGSDREVPMNKTVTEILTKLKATARNKWVFQSSRYDRRLINPKKWFETVIRDAKIVDFHWHDLRHTFCSRLVMAGVDLRTVMELAGHKSISVTTRYSHLAPEHNIAAIEKLDRVS